MSLLPAILSGLAAIVSVLIAVSSLVFFLAAGANSTPQQIRELKLMCWTLVIATIIGIAATITLLILKRPWWSLAAASSPAAFALALLIILFIRGDRSSAPAPDGFVTNHAPQTAPETPMANKGDEYNQRKEAEHREADHQAFLAQVHALESADELEAMEKAITSHDNTLWSYCHLAEMYRRRMMRMKEAGNMAAAEEAFAKSYDWMCSFASGATSGGEGTANSMMRDDHLETLTRELGYLPKAVTPWNS